MRRAQVGEYRRERERVGVAALDDDVRRHRIEVEVDLGARVDDERGGGVVEQRDRRDRAAGADGDQRRLGGEREPGAQRGHVGITRERAVALGAQGAGAGEYGVGAAAQGVEHGPVTGVAQARRAAADTRPAVGAGHEVRDGVGPIRRGRLGETQRADQLRGVGGSGIGEQPSHRRHTRRP